MTTMASEDDAGELPRDGGVAEARTIGPSWLPMTLVIVATVLAVVGALTTWVRTQALDTDAWVEVSGQLLAEPEVQQALASYLTDELYSQVDVTGELADALPDPLTGLAGPLAAGLREPATDLVEKLVASPRFGQAWAEANRKVHQRLVAVLRGESTEALSTADGTITLELGDVLVAVGRDLGVPEATLGRIPPDAGQVVLMHSDRLAEAQQAVRTLETMSWFLYLLVVGLYALAVYLSRGRRRRALQQVGVGLVVAGLVLVLARAIGVRTTVDLIVGDATNRPVATVVGRVGTQLLGQIGWAEVVYGLLFLAFAALLGARRWAVWSRRHLARWADATWGVVAATAILVIGLVWWSPGRTFDHWATALVLVGLAVGAVAALVTQVRHEFPQALPAGASDPGPSPDAGDLVVADAPRTPDQPGESADG